MTSESTVTLAGRYLLLEKMPPGGFADVWRAQDTRLKREVAVKLPVPRLLEREGGEPAQHFFKEARAAAGLSHPHIVTVHDVGREGTQFYIVMEYLSGGDLAKRLRALGPYALEAALDVLRPIAAALDYAHGRGLVHRDVKPRNILFRGDGAPVLTDFGLAKVLQGGDAGTMSMSSGRMLGTPEYMAPEQAESKAVSPATDVYALAVTLFQLLTGKVPFKGDSAPATLYLTTTSPREELADRLPPGVPSRAVQALLAGLAILPAERPASAGAFLELFAQPVAKAPRAADGMEPLPGYDLIIETPEHGPERITLTAARIALGRDADNDIVLPAPEVAPSHAVIQASEVCWYVEDRISAAGTFLNEERLTALVPRPYMPGDRVRIGPYRLTLTKSAPAKEQPAPRLPEAPRGFSLVIETPGYPPSTAALTRTPVTLGRGAESDIVLPAAGVARRHATLLAAGDGWQVQDNGGGSGTQLNETRLTPNQPVALEAGARLRIGPYTLTLRKEDAP